MASRPGGWQSSSIPMTPSRLLVFFLVSCCASEAECTSAEQDSSACAPASVKLEGADDSTLLQVTGIVSHTKSDDPSRAVYTVWNPSQMQTQRGLPDYDANSTRQLLYNLKVKANAEGDLDAFFFAFGSDTAALLMLVSFFCVAYGRYPLVYKDNALKGIAPLQLDNTYLGWLGSAWKLTSDEIEHTGGLDAAMLIYFVDLALKFFLVIGVPMVVILCPLHAFAGGHPANTDKLSQLGMANVVEGEGGGLIYWVHAIFVWYVIVMAQRLIFQAQEHFVTRRSRWIRQMPKPRSTTVLVEGIPEECCTDQTLKDEFCKLFPGDKIESAYIVRKTAKLVSLVDSYRGIEQSLAEANFEWQSLGGTDNTRPQCRDWTFGKLVDKIEFYTEQQKIAADAVIEERRALSDPNKKEQVLSHAGFVTFKTERDTAIALSLKVRADEYVFLMSSPPDPADVIYSDLLMDENAVGAKATLGHICCAGLFFAFVPIILAISSLVDLDVLRQNFAVVDKLIVAFPLAERALEGLCASAALTLFMSFLPTVFMIIFDAFYVLKAGRWSQHCLQIWYFWFQIIFVLLITAVGSSLWNTTVLLINHPTLAFELLATRLPATTHFYLSYVMIQWVIHGLNLTRYIQLSKFKALCLICEEDRAKELSEPEDQDYYGIGARSARFTLLFVIGLVFCNLCPLMTVVVGINFVICRVVYGYLMVFAETRKPDLGGVFWVTKLMNVQHGLLIYIILMVGVLSMRAASTGPAIVVFPALAFWLRNYFRFQSEFQWVSLPFEDFTKTSQASWGAQRESSRSNYEQPELTEPALSPKKSSLFS